MAYEILTDSAANLTKELIDKYKVKVMPLTYMINGEEFYADITGENADLKTFYESMKNGAKVSTSCVARAVFEEEFIKVLDSGKDIIYIGIAAGVSSTYDNANAVLEELKKKYPKRKMFAVNSMGAALGEGALVVRAFEKRAEGLTIEENYKYLVDLSFKMCNVFTVEDLKYFHNTGRIKKTTYILASALHIKPILRASEKDGGTIKMTGKAFGRKFTISSLAKIVANEIVDPENQTVYISHGYCYEDALLLKEKIESQIKVRDFVFNIMDSALGSHAGPGILAVFYEGSAKIPK